MSGRYVPPALRKKSQGDLCTSAAEPGAQTESSVDANLYSLEELERHFWPEAETGRGEKSKTLHDSAQTPGKLTYVLLFKGAHPRWDQEHIIYTKSSLDLLPEEIADTGSTPNISGNDENADPSSPTALDLTATTSNLLAGTLNEPTEPIPVFSQPGGAFPPTLAICGSRAGIALRTSVSSNLALLNSCAC